MSNSNGSGTAPDGNGSGPALGSNGSGTVNAKAPTPAVTTAQDNTEPLPWYNH